MALHPVRLMFSVAKEFGSMNSVRAKKGCVDQQRALKYNPAVIGRNIDIYARAFGFEHRFQVRLQPDPTISQMDVKVDIWRTPVNNGTFDECAIQNIDYDIYTMFTSSKKRGLDRYFTEGSTEKVFMMLARQNRDFFEMVKKFNTLVTEPMPTIEVKITFVSMNEFQQKLLKILSTMKKNMMEEQRIRTFECIAVEISRSQIDRTVQDKMFEMLVLASAPLFENSNKSNELVVRLERMYKDRLLFN